MQNEYPITLANSLDDPDNSKRLYDFHAIRLLDFIKYSIQQIYLDYRFIKVVAIFRPTHLFGLHFY